MLSLWLFSEILDLRDLEAFHMCKPPEFVDKPRWGRKPSLDVIIRRMGEKKWQDVEASIASVVTSSRKRSNF